ncbi:hypothetical protein [Panacagrimonas sp.]|uniref:hypothetical protein n=1 Tax=Panacagrimonas sp. TaxID=2480088 RepID=UPI003B51B888
MSTPRSSRAFARLLLVVSLGLTATAQAHGPRHASALIEPVPQSTATECRGTGDAIAYTPGPRSSAVPSASCRTPGETASVSPAAQGLMAYGPHGSAFLK